MNTSSISLFLATSVLALAGCEKPAAPAGPPPPPTVLVATVTQRDVPLYSEAVGTIDGYVNADIRARVRGFLRSQSYKDGAEVKAGELLFTVEPSEFVAAVESARGAVAQAKAVKSRTILDRDRNLALVDKGVVARSQTDDSVAQAQQAEGQLTSAQAQLTQSQLNLSYTQIRSPVAGIAGIAQVRVGNLVGQEGPTLLTTVSQVDPMRVSFPISEADFLQFGARFRHLDARDLAWARKQFQTLAAGGEPEGQAAIEVILADGKPYPLRGVIVSTNRQIDPSSGTLFPNPDKVLRPGQYGRVRLRRDDAGHGVLVVPARALIQVQGTYSLAVVGPDSKSHVRRVELGPAVGALQIIASGVAAGDRVIVEGLQKAPDGATVVAQPAPEGSGAGAASAAPPPPPPPPAPSASGR
jgi:membrane fusion protein (multidrug efflux system)